VNEPDLDDLENGVHWHWRDLKVQCPADETLVSHSGREGMPPGERARLLEAELMQPPFIGISNGTVAATNQIHDLKMTIGAMRNVIALYDRAVARGQPEKVLLKGADYFFSDIECWVLAWRRGGYREYVRIRLAQRARGERRLSATKQRGEKP
jgi:hypothetical protein